jgi:hypothetical protein
VPLTNKSARARQTVRSSTRLLFHPEQRPPILVRAPNLIGSFGRPQS